MKTDFEKNFERMKGKKWFARVQGKEKSRLIWMEKDVEKQLQQIGIEGHPIIVLNYKIPISQLNKESAALVRRVVFSLYIPREIKDKVKKLFKCCTCGRPTTTVDHYGAYFECYACQDGEECLE